jgi:hypothetical protein
MDPANRGWEGLSLRYPPAGGRAEPRRPALQCVRPRALLCVPGYADRIRRDVAMQNTEAPRARVSPQLPERTGRCAIGLGVLIRDSLHHAEAFCRATQFRIFRDRIIVRPMQTGENNAAL